MNLPNKLTMLRILMIPIFVVFAVMNVQWAQYVALLIYILACLTDLADGGHIVRAYVSARSKFMDGENTLIEPKELRLMRRMVRDNRTRATNALETMQMWDKVRAGEEKYIFPFQERADVMFNTSLLYEIAVLKKYAYPMLQEIEKNSEHYVRARRLVKFLHYFMDCDVESEIPPTSILREFIGGCTFYE